MWSGDLLLVLSLVVDVVLSMFGDVVMLMVDVVVV